MPLKFDELDRIDKGAHEATLIVVSHNNGVATMADSGKPVRANLLNIKQIMYEDSKKLRKSVQKNMEL